MLGARECEMEALEMVGLLILALIIGTVIHGMYDASKKITYWKNEASEWRKQVDDERTRQ